jgi:hypothetical protein
MPNPKKPVELANKLGNPGHRPAGDVLEVAQPVTALPVPPRDLRAAGVELFERVARAAAHWVSESDLPALENVGSSA